MLSGVHQASRRLFSAPSSTRFSRHLHIVPERICLKEFFVVVWDHPKADRSRISPFDLVPPFCTFVGECLGSDAAGNPVVKGNGFSCYASSVTNVKEKMESSIYSTKRIWDLSTASISPLLTVHTSDYDDIERGQRTEDYVKQVAQSSA